LPYNANIHRQGGRSGSLSGGITFYPLHYFIGEPMEETQREMPKYNCHKQVWALKIARIEFDHDKASAENRETDGSATITPAEDGYAPFRVDHEFMRKHKPEVGGYYVVYKDGYKSYSPAQAFDEGYSPA